MYEYNAMVVKPTSRRENSRNHYKWHSASASAARSLLLQPHFVLDQRSSSSNSQPRPIPTTDRLQPRTHSELSKCSGVSVVVGSNNNQNLSGWSSPGHQTAASIQWSKEGSRKMRGSAGPATTSTGEREERDSKRR